MHYAIVVITVFIEPVSLLFF